MDATGYATKSIVPNCIVQTKLYSISIGSLPGKIQPARCSIKYQRVGCLITLIKLHSTPWMNRIWDNLSHGLNIQENNDYSLLSPAPPKKVILKDTGIPPPLNLVPVVSSLSSQSIIKKRAAPPPPTNSRASSNTYYDFKNKN
ncbi:unnamed protein product [Adineta steineri]|uniref:Uncharacterized protein n=1 Tax=Adineta steineri TaxID=433720 RepID=A0A819ULG5_9BILA|nr:unnamed protein product [Adineta steineri]